MLLDVDTQLMASDEWLADFDGDGLAEMAVGRLPVRTAVEASRMIDKLVDYERAPGNRNIFTAIRQAESNRRRDYVKR